MNNLFFCAVIIYDAPFSGIVFRAELRLAIGYNALMTGNGHRLTAFAVFMAATGSLFVSALATLGSVFPDSIEHLLWREGRNRHHRRTSHWFAIYLAGFWFLGGLTHVLCDACCGKVPLLIPWKKTFGRKFFEMSGARGEMSRGEAIFTGFIVLSCLCAWLKRYGI